jgi:hypothetical protein
MNGTTSCIPLALERPRNWHPGAAGGRRGFGVDDEDDAMRRNPGAQYEISIDGIPRTYRDQRDIALATAEILKARDPTSVVKLKDLQSGEETIVAFKAGE